MDVDQSNTVECPELENIFHWKEERACFNKQWIDDQRRSGLKPARISCE